MITVIGLSHHKPRPQKIGIEINQKLKQTNPPICSILDLPTNTRDTQSTPALKGPNTHDKISNVRWLI